MASSLIGGRGKDRVTDKGHGTNALGPSDSSDSASDIVGGPGAIEGDVIGLDSGTNEDSLTRANDDVLPDHIERITEIADVDDEDGGGKRS